MYWIYFSKLAMDKGIHHLTNVVVAVRRGLTNEGDENRVV